MGLKNWFRPRGLTPPHPFTFGPGVRVQTPALSPAAAGRTGIPAGAGEPPSSRLLQQGDLNPQGGLIADSSGNLFGTTSQGGTVGDGTVFEVATGSETITTLATFTGANGCRPHGGLVEDSSGNLFGTTTVGGAVWTTARCSRWRRAAGPSPPWPPSTATNGSLTPRAAWSRTASGNLFGTTT